MPIYRFHCPECDRHFELLLPRYDAEAHCPVCQSAELERENTSFAAVTKNVSGCAASGICPRESAACGCGCGCGGHHHH